MAWRSRPADRERLSSRRPWDPTTTAALGFPGGPAGTAPTVAGRSPRRRGGDRMPPQDIAAEQSRPRRHAAVQGRHRRRRRDRSAAATSTGRPTRRSSTRSSTSTAAASRPTPITVAAELRRRGELAADRRRALPAHALGLGPDRRQRRLLRRHRPREGGPAPAGRGRHQDRPDGVRRRRGSRSTTSSTAPRQEVYAGHRAAHLGGLRAAGRRSWRRPSTRSRRSPPRRRDGRRPDRLRRPRRADQRPARRPDDHHRGASGGREGAGARHPAADPDGWTTMGDVRGRRPAPRRGRRGPRRSSRRPR